MSLSKKIQDAMATATLLERHRILQICQGLIDEARSETHFAPDGTHDHKARRALVAVLTLELVIKNVKSGFTPKVSGSGNGEKPGDPEFPV